ncbi:hypothetical protein [Micromonospora wenchangensis]|uniref:Uncharacterized protein n=1 Tax=Micromonospora wenchangensis TaxID=1185415 RepID=A0A246RNJ8_9ACTN|nr:hypothetical protein [Micromonospora wenchangensis]OWV08845.1 hypothetical protein B5D80_10805 [Micromonospora wenchangensis]
MRRAGTATTTGRWLRLLLLVGTLLGLSAMHTLGHDTHLAGGDPVGHDTATGGPHRSTAGHDAPADRSLLREPVPAVGGCGDGCAAALPGGSPDSPSTAWSVCLAVLGAFTVTVLVLLLAVRSRPAGVSRPPSRPREPRAPPPRPLGLRLATVSVLRR